jgi:hypothetical protein
MIGKLRPQDLPAASCQVPTCCRVYNSPPPVSVKNPASNINPALETTAATETHLHLYDITTRQRTTTEDQFHSHELCLQSAETVACSIHTDPRLGSDNVAEKRREATGGIAL